MSQHQAGASLTTETVRSVASKSTQRFIGILFIASIPAFLEGFD